MTLQLHNEVKLQRWELNKIYELLGGRFSLLERLKMGGNGSPMVYYESGSLLIDKLNDLSNEPLRVSMELLKTGLLIRIAERTNPYIFPIPYEYIQHFELTQHAQQLHLTIHTSLTQPIVLWERKEAFKRWERFLNGSVLRMFL